MVEQSAIEGQWRVVLFTVNPMFIPKAEAMLNERGHRLVGIVTAPGPRSRRTNDYLEVLKHARPGLDVISSNTPSRWAGMVRTFRPDLLCCLGFNWKIPADVLAIPPLGTLNRHDGPLPRYRGRNATGWQLRNDEPEFGITAHFMTPELDEGPILAQRLFPVTDDDLCAMDIIPRFIDNAWEVFGDALDSIARGEPGAPQDSARATHTSGAFEPEWRHIDWSRPARNIFLQIRSWYGARDVPLGAFAEIDDKQILITRSRLPKVDFNAALPGTVLEHRDDGSLLIQCGDGPLEILDWELCELPASDTQHDRDGQVHVSTPL